MTFTNNQEDKEGCPLCETTKEVVNNFDKIEKSSASSRKLGLLLLVIVITAGTFAVYKFSASFSSKSAQVNGISEQTENRVIGGVEIGKIALDFTSEDVDGNKISLSDFRNKKPVLLVFWATWCGYCAKEKEDLKTFTQKYQNEIQVLAVDSSEPRAIIQDYIEKQDINFLMLLDENRKIWNQYLVRGTPSHFLIDKDGKIITMRPGLASLIDLETMLTMLK